MREERGKPSGACDPLAVRLLFPLNPRVLIDVNRQQPRLQLVWECCFLQLARATHVCYVLLQADFLGESTEELHRPD